MTSQSQSVWFRQLALTGLVIGLALAQSEVRAQPTAAADKAAEEADAQGASADKSLNLGAMVEKYPEIKKIIETFKDGDREKTMADLNVFADAHDDLPPGGIILALVFSAPQQAGAQQQALDAAARANPTDPDAFLLLAQKAVSQRRVTEAAMLLDAAEPLIKKYQVNPERKRSMLLRFHRDRALLSEQHKEWPEAAGQWAKLLDVEDTAGARYRYARALFYKDTPADRKKALVEVTQANKMNDKIVPLPYVAIAMLYDEIKDAEKTKEWFEAAEKAYPDDANMHLRFALWQWKHGDAAEALRHAEAAAKLDPENVDPKFLIGMIMRYNNEPSNAEEIFVECLKMRPDVPLIRNHLALVRLDIGDATSTTMAVNMAAKTFQKNQRDPFTAATLGYILFKARDKEKGLKYLQAIARAPNLTLDARFFLASTLVDLGKTADAKKQLEQLLSGEELFAYRSQAERLLGALE